MRRRSLSWAVGVLVACLTAGSNAGAAPVPRAAQLDFSVNEQTLVPWGYVHLGYRIKSFQVGRRVDLYVAVQQGRTDQCTPPEMLFVSPPPPSATDVALADTRGDLATGFLPANLAPLTMRLFGVLVERGTSPADPANWLSNLAALDLAMAALSASQTEVLVARGNPHSYVVEFYRGSQQRIETWSYNGGGLGREFQFINGRPLSNDEVNERAPATNASHPVAFGPGTFGPGTTPAEIRAFLGDPDRVVTNSPGTQLWIFTGSRISVLVENGTVRRIVAY